MHACVQQAQLAAAEENKIIGAAELTAQLHALREAERNAAELRAQEASSAQEDGGASLGLPGTNVSSSTTWSLAEDHKMRFRAADLRATDDDPQFQHWYGKDGQPVLTGQATAIVHSMLQLEGVHEGQGCGAL